MSERDIFLKTILPIWETFLTKWHHHLTLIIRPRAFYSYLKAQEIFTINDEELVEKTFVQTSMKAGCLIDTIARKGEKGFIAFMEVVEYTYPELFRTLTNITPREPPDEYKSMARESTTNNLLECLSMLQESLQEKRDKLERMNNSIIIMQEEFSAKEKKLNEEIVFLTGENEKLRKELASLKKLKAPHEVSGTKADNERPGTNESRTRCASLNVEVVREELRKKTDNERLHVNESKDRCASLHVEGIKQEKPEKSEKIYKNNIGVKGIKGKINLESSIKNLESERDKYKKLFEDSQLALEKERSINKKQDKECKECARNQNSVLDIMAKLEQEIMEQKQEKIDQIHYSKKLRGPINKPVSNAESESKNGRRCAAVFHANPPLLVYSPKSVRKEVSELLAKQLGRIPEDLIQNKDEIAELINDLEVLYYEKTDCGYSCIRNSKLKQMGSTALLDLSVAFVSHLMKVSIYPIVVVVKPHDYRSPTEEEEYLRMLAFNYHVIDVDPCLANDAHKLVPDILPRIKSLIESKSYF